MIALIAFLIAFYIVTFLVFTQLMVENTAEELFATNIVLAIFMHIVFLPEAIGYWIYRAFKGY
jgi:hypothetical protein